MKPLSHYIKLSDFFLILAAFTGLMEAIVQMTLKDRPHDYGMSITFAICAVAWSIKEHTEKAEAVAQNNRSTLLRGH